MRRLVRLIATFALVLLWVVAVTTASARTTRGGNGAPAARAAAVTPADGASYPAGTDFTIPCVSPTPRPQLHALISTLNRADPRVPTRVYPARNAGWDVEQPNKTGVAPWPAITQVASNDYQSLSPSPGAWTCAPKSTQSNGVEVPGAVFAIWQPGYYHLIEFDVNEHHQPLQPPPYPPDTATCSDDIGGAAYISAIGNYNDGTTMVVGHCRHYINIYFMVYASGDCQGLTIPHVTAPYINQYDWGNESGGPPRDDHGDPGGNACGSSSLNMLLFRATSAATGAQPSTSLYNGTANKPVGNGKQNEFNWDKAQALVASEGYKNARVVGLGGSVDPRGVAAENRLSDFLQQGPVLTSTLFGDGDWSQAGGGHVILFLRKAAGLGAGESAGDYIVNDPAGPFFLHPKYHYGPLSCGYLARYPVTWVAALTLNRWGLLLGKKVGPTADAARAGHTAVLLEVPNGGSVWVQDRNGHRVGFVGQNQTVGLSGITLNDEPTAPSDPRSPFVSPSALVPDRGIIALDPGKGLTLVARGRRGHRITAKMFVYRNGALIKTVSARVVLRSGVTRLLSLPSVPGGRNLPLGQLRLRVKPAAGPFGISVSSKAPFAGFVTVNVSQGSRSVGFGAKRVKAGAFSVPVFLFSGTKGTVTVTAKLVGSGRSVSGSTTAQV